MSKRIKLSANGKEQKTIGKVINIFPPFIFFFKEIKMPK
jgi:hypothetical protein